MHGLIIRVVHFVADSAKEKMLAENENKVGAAVGVADVKFTENQNGDAKLDIGKLLLYTQFIYLCNCFMLFM